MSHKIHLKNMKFTTLKIRYTPSPLTLFLEDLLRVEKYSFSCCSVAVLCSWHMKEDYCTSFSLPSTTGAVYTLLGLNLGLPMGTRAILLPHFINPMLLKECT